MIIKQISYNDIQHYVTDAKRSHLTFCASTILYGLIVNNEIVAFAGLIIKNNKAVFKNSYVPANQRGNGHFKKLVNYRLALCKSLNIKVMEATCTQMSIKYFLENGFKIVKEYKNYKKVRYENI